MRTDLNEHSKRAFAVLDPLKITISNYPEGENELITVPNHPQRPEFGTRDIVFGKTIFIERDDFKEEAPSKFFRLKPGKEVRLRYAYVIRCDEVIKGNDGEIKELICSYDQTL